MNPEKKTLLKIRLRSDGKWEHVYSDGSVDQNFYQMDSQDLVSLYKNERDKKLEAYAKLEGLKESLIERALELSNCEEAKQVINYIKSK